MFIKEIICGRQKGRGSRGTVGSLGKIDLFKE
jgi:hypothetical protein